MKILLIEHDARDVRRLKELLNEAARGYCDITVARRLSSALAKLRAELFDIVLLELSLPDSQGLDTFLNLQALIPGVPVLVLTGRGNEEAAISAVGRGAYDYFIKGQLDGASLVRAIRYAIEHARSEEMLRRNAAILQMLQEMTVATNEADSLEHAMRYCVERICTFMHWPVGHVYVCTNGNEDSLIRSDIWHLADKKRFGRFRQVTEQLKSMPNSSLTAQVLGTGQAAWVKDVQKHPNFRRAKTARRLGLRSAFAFPVLEGKKVAAILEFFSERVAEADDAMLEAITHLGTQLGRVTERIKAQQALRQSEQRFRDLIEGSIQGILIQRDRQPLFVNQAYADILGYVSPENILALKSIDAFFAPYELARVRKYNEIRLAGGQAPSQYEYDAIRKDGSVVTLQNVVRVVNWEGKPAIQSTVIDITERRRAERTLQGVIDAVPAMISAKDDRSRYIFMNRYQAKLYGTSPETAVGKTAAEIVNARYGAYTEALDRRVFATGKAIPYFEETYTDTNNPTRTFLTTKVPLHRVNGQVTQLATVSLDITDRKLTEDNLRRSQRSLAEAQRIAHIGSWECDIPSGMLSWSDEVYRIFGLQPQEFRPNYEAFISCVHPEDRERVKSVLAAAMEKKQHYGIDYRVVRPNGEIRVVHAEAEVFVDDAGGPPRMTGTVQDITESKHLEQALEVRARQQAVIAELGQLALGGGELADLLSESVKRIAETLNVEYCKVLELLPDGNAMVLRAGVGWHPGAVGHATVDTKASNSQAAFTLYSEEPVIVADLRTETRFSGPSLLQEHGVVSGVSVVIAGHKQPFGVLGVHTCHHRTFAQDDVNFLRAAANVLTGAIERKRAEQTLAQRARRFAGLLRTSAKVAAALEETEHTLRGIAEEAANLLGLEGAGYRLLEGDDLVVAGRYGLAQAVMLKHALKVGESLTGLVAKEGRTIAVADLRTDQRLHPDHKRVSIAQGIVAYLGTPLRYRERLIGVLNVYAKTRHEFDEEEIALLQAFADHAAIAIEKARLYGQAKRHAEELGKEIAERTRVEEDLRKNQRNLAEAQRIAHIGSWECNIKTGQLSWSDEVYRIFGLERPDFGGTYEDFCKRVHPEDRGRVARVLEEAQRRYKGYSIEHRIVRPHGEVRIVHEQAEIKCGGRGEACYLVGTVQDITERVRAEEALRESEEQFRAVVDNSPSAILLKDTQGRFLIANKQWHDWFNPHGHNIIGKTVYDFFPLEHANAVAVQDREVLATKTAIEREIETPFKDGTLRTTILHKFPIFGPDGRPIAIGGFNIDITERKRAQEEIERLNEELEQRVLDRTAELEAANRELEAFSYSVSHDLRAPLRHVSGFVELLQKHALASLDERGQRYLNIISQSAERMGVLIDDLLDFSRAGRLEPHKSAVDLGELVREVLDELASEAQGRTIEWKIDPLPVVHADRSMLRLVLLNLVGNAVKFTRARACARIEIGTQPDPANRVIISVRDNGAGFDMKYVDKLFNVFQRLHSVDQYEGTGIGLASVRRIVQRHGGETWAEGQIDKGAVFHFSLPRQQKGERDEQAQTDIAGGGRRQRYRADAHGSGGTSSLRRRGRRA